MFINQTFIGQLYRSTLSVNYATVHYLRRGRLRQYLRTHVQLPLRVRLRWALTYTQNSDVLCYISITFIQKFTIIQHSPPTGLNNSVKTAKLLPVTHRGGHSLSASQWAFANWWLLYSVQKSCALPIRIVTTKT